MNAWEIRAAVDARFPRVKDDGWTINAAHVAAEQTLREQSALPSYIGELDGPGAYRPVNGHQRTGRQRCSCGSEPQLGTDVNRWWDRHLVQALGDEQERPKECLAAPALCLGIECMTECSSTHRLTRYVALSQDGVIADLEAPAQTRKPDPGPVLRDVDRLLDAILIRCREGDPRSDWLPVIDRLASEAREKLGGLLP